GGRWSGMPPGGACRDVRGVQESPELVFGAARLEAIEHPAHAGRADRHRRAYAGKLVNRLDDARVFQQLLSVNDGEAVLGERARADGVEPVDGDAAAVAAMRPHDVRDLGGPAARLLLVSRSVTEEVPARR